MKGCIYKTLHQLFPIPTIGPADKFVKNALQDAAQVKNIDALNYAMSKVQDAAKLKHIRDHAAHRTQDEDARQSSIISRAQGMLVALTLFGFVLTFAINLLTTTSQLNPSWYIFCVASIAFIVSQVAIMAHNILRAIGGVSYSRVGSSDLAKWMSLMRIEDIYRADARITLDHYRYAALNNNWRFYHLNLALSGLRNIIVGLGLFVLVSLVWIPLSSISHNQTLFWLVS